LVLLFRLLQGFALGGELGPSTAFLVEAAPPGKRGLFVAQIVAGPVGTLLDADQLQDWGWRLAMLGGAAIVPFGLMIRRSLPETLHTTEPEAAPKPGAKGAAGRFPYAGLVVLGVMMLMAGTIGTYVGAYLTTYALTALHMGATAAFGVIAFKSMIGAPMALVGGWLSDRHGRRPVMLIAGSMLLVSIIPAFAIVIAHPSVVVFYSAAGFLSLLGALTGAPMLVTICESLPRRIRAGAVSMIYAVAISIFGGSTQFVVARLTGLTKDPLAPAYYWTVAAAIGVFAMYLVTESAPQPRRPT
jgi:MHS family citrate/tricarballylate:H+ symporter-like MFS transporter